MPTHNKEDFCGTTITKDPSISQQLCSALPTVPFDGQVFIDANNVKWIWDEQQEVWSRVGAVIEFPVATSSTPGLMSKEHKAVIDSIPPVGGSFGLITQPLLLYQENPDGITQGDIVLCSDSLDIQCVDIRGEVIEEQCNTATICDVDGLTPGLQFNISQVFLDTLCFEATGPPGPIGEQGEDGDDGLDGFKDSPQGDQGEVGRDATEGFTITGMRIEELEDIVDSAIVDATLDSASGRMSYTVSKMNVPENDEPADQVVVIPVARNLYYPIIPEDPDEYVTLDDWVLDLPADDPIGEPELLLFKMDSTTDVGAEVELETVRLTTLIESIVAFYKACLKSYDDAWLEEVCAFISGKDSAARSILAAMAARVSECEFDRPIQFCLGVEPGECPEPLKRNVTIDEFNDVLQVDIIPSLPPSPGP
jgi:hypothetical protein